MLNVQRFYFWAMAVVYVYDTEKNECTTLLYMRIKYKSKPPCRSCFVEMGNMRKFFSLQWGGKRLRYFFLTKLMECACFL